MPRISVLPEHIASQIAAGEVVERPASVVKELVENAIDAGATRITVDVSEGCCHIRVADNGCGMEADDASLAFQRHATSKLSSADDLWNLGTLGFRGEALPSIAAVSHLTCCTRTENNEIGTKAVCAEGVITLCETGCARGTIIEVADLFYNVPARLKFLKKPATEFAYIHETIQSLAITYPEIAFQLSFDGKTRLATNGSGKLNDALRESDFFQKENSDSKNNLIHLEARDGVLGMELEGRLVSAISFRGDRKGILTIVNGRPVRCGITYKALDNAYADLIPRGRYPLAVVHLKINPAELDINIHPTKKEIRYSKGNEIYLFLQRQIAHALRIARNIHGASEANSGLDFSPAENQSATKNQPITSNTKTSISYAPEISTQLLLRESTKSSEWNSFRQKFDAPPAPDSHITSSISPISPSVGVDAIDPRYGDYDKHDGHELHAVDPILPLDWRIAGYIGNTYILIENQSGLSIVEQHIAHERVLYEQLLSRRKPSSHTEDLSTDKSALAVSALTAGSADPSSSSPVLDKVAVSDVDYRQNLIISLPLNLTEEQKSVLHEHLAALATQGFEFEFSENDIACSQVPVELAHKDYAKIIQTMLQELAESSSANPQLDIIKSLACQSAIKNGMPLSTSQIIDLLNLWYAAPRNETCPHGRPIQLNYSYDKLFQLFHPA